MRLYTVLALVAVASGTSPVWRPVPDLSIDKRCPDLSSGIGKFGGGIISTCDVDMRCSSFGDAGSFNIQSPMTSTTSQCEREGGFCCPKACGGLGCNFPSEKPTCSKKCDMDPCCGCDDNGLEFMSACRAPPMCMTENGHSYEAETISGTCCSYKPCASTGPKTPYCGKMGNPQYDVLSGQECECHEGEDKVWGWGNNGAYCMEELICKSPKVKRDSTGCEPRCSEIYEPRNYGCDPIPEPTCACPHGTYIGNNGACLTHDECPKPDGWCGTNADCATGEKCEQGGLDHFRRRVLTPPFRNYKTCVADTRTPYCGKMGKPEYDVKSGEECVCGSGEDKVMGYFGTPGYYCMEELICKSPKVKVSSTGCEPRCSEIYEPRYHGCDPIPEPACACPSGTYIGDVAGVSGCLTRDECPKPTGWCETNADCATGEKCDQGGFDSTSRFGEPRNYKTCVADPDSGPSCEDSKYFGKSKVAKTCKKVAKKAKKAKKKLSKGKKTIKKNPDSKKAKNVDLDKLQNAVDTAEANKDHCDWFVKNC